MLKQAGFEYGEDFWWSDGLRVEYPGIDTLTSSEEREVAGRLCKALNASGEFGKATWKPHKHRIEFGVHPMYKKTRLRKSR